MCPNKLFGVLLALFLVISVNGDDFLTLKKVLQYNTNDLEISPLCKEQLQLLGAGLQNLNENTMWAWQMVDATAKLQSGILAGNNAEFGAFDECIGIKSNTTIGQIRGKYCLGNLVLAGTNNVIKKLKQQKLRQNFELMAQPFGAGEGSGQLGLMWGACMPDACTGEEMGKVYNTILGMLETGLPIGVLLPENRCQTVKEVYPELNTNAIIGIVIFSIILGFMCLSTIYDIFLHYSKSEPNNSLWIAFSIFTNGKKLFKISSNAADHLPCLNGLRVISMMWVILGHQYSMMGWFGIFNGLEALEWMNSLGSMYVAGGTVSVDTFFLLGGILMTYGFLKSMENGLRFNVFMYWLHRYLRLTPALAAAVVLDLGLVNYLGSGPGWPFMSTMQNCNKYWWSTLLYIQNWVNIDQMCVGVSWYLSVDMQLFILSPLILLPLWKWKKAGLFFLSFLILVSIAIPFTVAWINDLHAFINLSDEQLTYDFMNKYYLVTYTRATPWLVGILIGYFIFHLKNKKIAFKLNNALILLLWAISLSVLITCTFGGHSTLNESEYDKWAHVSHVTFIRPAWAIALSWIIIACVTGFGGPINWILSLPIYQVLGRLTYSMYLLHLTVLTVKILSSRLPIFFSDVEAIYNFWGTFIFTAFLSVVWVLAFESPMIIIEKILFHRKDGAKDKKKSLEEAKG